jgi:lipocalin
VITGQPGRLLTHTGQQAGEGFFTVYSMIKWIGPGAVVGGLGAAMFCGAGLASADTGNEARSADRGANASATASASVTPARKARSGPARGARVAAPEAPASRIGAVPASESALESAPESLSVPESAPETAPESVSVPESAPVSVSTPVSVAVPVAQARTQRGRVQPVAALQVNDDSPASPVRVAAAPPAAAIAATAPTAAATAAPVPVVPSSVPVDPAQFAGTYYEQGSVKQFFSLGLVNTKAVYTVRPDGTLGVRNSGNYFFKWGPRSSISGAAVPVNPINTALNVGFGGSTPSKNPPGNYLILDRAPDYSWVIVSDSSGRSGFILTRDQTIDPKTYQQLVGQARALGVRGRITPTYQFPG